MNNDEIRYSLIKQLYDRFYEGEHFGLVGSDELINECDLDSENKDVVTANIDYITRNYYVHGLRGFGQAYPTHVRLEVAGIDFIESKKPDLLNHHNHIRFRILNRLYREHFGGNLGKYFSTMEIIEELNLENTNEEIIGDTIYLEKSGYLKGQYSSGRAYPFVIMIDTYGIDTVENIIEQAAEQLEDSDFEQELKTEISNIKDESDKPTRAQKFEEFLSKYQNSTKFGIEIAKIIATFLGVG